MSPYTIKHWTDKGFSEEDAKYQISIRRIYNKNYWTHKFGESDGMKKYYEFITKGTAGKKKSSEQKKSNMRCREYWKNKGLSDIEIDKEISNIQKTFTLESCIKKYGESIGREKFSQRQSNWQTTMKNKSKDVLMDINLRKDSQSIDHFIKKYGDCWVDEFLDRKVGKTEVGNFIRRIISEFKTREEFIKGFNKISPKFMVLRRILSSKIIQKIFSIKPTETNDVFLEILKTYGIHNWSSEQYGQSASYNGIKYKSSGELEIAKFLDEKKIKFYYNQKYPNQFRHYYDFYLVDYDYYIEYSGLSGKSFYDKRIENKRKMCIELNFKCFISKNIQSIKNKILDVSK